MMKAPALPQVVLLGPAGPQVAPTPVPPLWDVKSEEVWDEKVMSTAGWPRRQVRRRGC